MIDTDSEVKIINALEEITLGKEKRYKFKSKHYDFNKNHRVIKFIDNLYNTELEVLIK